MLSFNSSLTIWLTHLQIHIAHYCGRSYKIQILKRKVDFNELNKILFLNGPILLQNNFKNYCVFCGECDWPQHSKQNRNQRLFTWSWYPIWLSLCWLRMIYCCAPSRLCSTFGHSVVHRKYYCHHSRRETIPMLELWMVKYILVFIGQGENHI